MFSLIVETHSQQFTFASKILICMNPNLWMTSSLQTGFGRRCHARIILVWETHQVHQVTSIWENHQLSGWPEYGNHINFTIRSDMGNTSTSSTLPSMGNVSTSLSSLLMGKASTSSYGGRYGKGINLLTVYLWEKGQHPQILPVTCARLGDNGSMNQNMGKASSHGRNWCGKGINNTP